MICVHDNLKTARRPYALAVYGLTDCIDVGCAGLAQPAGTTDVNAVRQAIYGQRVKAPSGFEVVMNTDHLSKPEASGTFDVVCRSINPSRLRSGEISSHERQTHRRLDISLGLRRVHRADIQGLVIGFDRYVTDRKLKDAAAQALSIMAQTTAGLERVPR